MTTEYKKEVKTVIHNGLVIGFMVRREVLWGCAQEIPNFWAVTTSLLDPDWQEGFATKKEARKYLQRSPNLDTDIIY